MTKFTPCSAKHGKYCSPAHAAMVWGYRAERARQEQSRDKITNGHAGDERHWKAKGGNLIDFKSWLKAHKGIGNKNGTFYSEQRENGRHSKNQESEILDENVFVSDGRR